ncbi:cell wall hydrolase [Devosia sp.]|uniref:cell wall hydrolase n=1 Tax=Devosia sp. TaxID=1871048 RepID=UPI003A8EC553
MLAITFHPASAEELAIAPVVPIELPEGIVEKRQEFHAVTQPKLTSTLVAAYAERQKKIEAFDGFDVPAPLPELTEEVLLGYIDRQRNQALDAIERVDITAKPALNAEVLSDYVTKDFVPTEKRVKLADDEKLCLAQAIYHEARGESREGQLAVANVIINRAMNKRYPSTICGVVFQNADKGKFRCQFTFACDGRSDFGSERAAWNRSMKMAETAFHEFQDGETPGVVPNSVLFYHTTAVKPSWSRSFHRVAAIGSHLFYAKN